MDFEGQTEWQLHSGPHDRTERLPKQRWYLRFHKSLTALGSKGSSIDSALWMLWSPTGECEGMIRSYISFVDDLIRFAVWWK